MNNDRLENILLKNTDSEIPILGKSINLKGKTDYLSDRTFCLFDDCNPYGCGCNTTCGCVEDTCGCNDYEKPCRDYCPCVGNPCNLDYDNYCPRD